METHRSLKAECPGSILGERQFFIFISSVIYFFFPIFIILVTAGPQGQRSKIVMWSFVPFFCSHYPRGGPRLADFFFPILPENLTSHPVRKTKI